MSLKNVDELLLDTQMAQETPIEPQEGVPPEPSMAESPQEPENAPELPIDSAPTDDYGNIVPPEDPPEEMIPKSVMRERLERKNREAEQRILEAEQRTREQVMREMQQRAPQDEPDSGDWQQELKSLIIETQKEEQTRAQEHAWRTEQAEIQSQFEVKFNKGAARYNDFEDVVMGKSITPQMAMATRGMDDPAAFIYAAAKGQPQELDRISKIHDPYAQAIELGRLEERMKKARSNTSSAPKPVTPIRGDVSEKAPSRNNIDDILVKDERDRLKGRK